MPKFGWRSKNNLAQCHRDLQTVFNEVIKIFDCSVICGHRGKANQNLAYRKGYSKLKYPKSKHNKKPSMAVDVIPYPIEWKNLKRMRFFAGFVLGVAHMLKEAGKISNNIRSGIDWDMDTKLNDQNFNDLPHYEISRRRY